VGGSGVHAVVCALAGGAVPGVVHCQQLVQGSHDGVPLEYGTEDVKLCSVACDLQCQLMPSHWCMTNDGLPGLRVGTGMRCRIGQVSPAQPPPGPPTEALTWRL
jgi:hypothetical protein